MRFGGTYTGSVRYEKGAAAAVSRAPRRSGNDDRRRSCTKLAA